MLKRTGKTTAFCNLSLSSLQSLYIHPHLRGLTMGRDSSYTRVSTLHQSAFSSGLTSLGLFGSLPVTSSFRGPGEAWLSRLSSSPGQFRTGDEGQAPDSLRRHSLSQCGFCTRGSSASQPHPDPSSPPGLSPAGTSGDKDAPPRLWEGPTAAGTLGSLEFPPAAARAAVWQGCCPRRPCDCPQPPRASGKCGLSPPSCKVAVTYRGASCGRLHWLLSNSLHPRMSQCP